MTKYTEYPISDKVTPMLVITSAKKKSLNLTRPKGAIIISLRVIRSCNLAVPYPHPLKGYIQYKSIKANRAIMNQGNAERS